MCRERDADFEVTIATPWSASGCRCCARVLGPWSVTQVCLLDGRPSMTLMGAGPPRRHG
jgi:hypothetical protein